MEEELYVLIDRYVAGELTAEERAAFNARLNTDTDFAEKVRIYQSLTNNLSSRYKGQQRENDLRETLSRIAANELEAGSNTRSLNWYYWAAAACVLIICGVFFYSSFDQQPSYAEFAIHEPLALAERSTADSVVIKAEESFNNKEYKQALSYFDQLLEDDQENAELQLYKGIVLLELNRFDEAERIFSVVQNSNSVFKTKALWYQALSKLKQNRYDECRTIAKQIPEGSDEYDNAQELLERLD